MDDLIYIENMLNFKFPNGYRDFSNQIAYTNSKNIVLKCREEFINIKKILSLGKNDKDNIIEVYNENRCLMVEDIIPIAETEDDDYICLYYCNGRDKEPQIIQWIYELAVEKREDGIFALFGSFKELIDNIQFF